VSARPVAAAAILVALAPLVAAFAAEGRPLGVAAAGACAAAWLAVWARRSSGATACLVAAEALAALAIVTGSGGAPAWLPSLGGAGALAAWDLTGLGARGGPPAHRGGERALLRSRLLALSLGILPGLAAALALGGVRLHAPFAVVLAAGALALLLLDRAARRWVG
jgi:hypothetical protein